MCLIRISQKKRKISISNHKFYFCKNISVSNLNAEYLSHILTNYMIIIIELVYFLYNSLLVLNNLQYSHFDTVNNVVSMSKA